MSHELSRAALLALLAERILAVRSGHPVRVAIDGRSAAGKSTLTHALTDRVREAGRAGYSCELDDFHPPGHKYRSAAGYFDTLEKYLTDGYDFESFRRLVLDPAGPGGSRRCCLARWNSLEDEPYPERWVTLEDDAVLITDGAFLLLPEFRRCFDFTIWLEIDTGTLLDRVSDRDVWIGDPRQIRENYQRGWIPRHEKYEAVYRPQTYADIVVDNRQPEHPRVIRHPAQRD